jgi:hypothetical protein
MHDTLIVAWAQQIMKTNHVFWHRLITWENVMVVVVEQYVRGGDVCTAILRIMTSYTDAVDNELVWQSTDSPQHTDAYS